MAQTSSGRECGSCGASVDAAAVTCPACDALLAAYEAPSGSGPAVDIASKAAFDPVPTPTIEPVTISAPGIVSPESTPAEQRTSPNLSTDEAVADARRSLGMPPAEPRPTPTTPPRRSEPRRETPAPVTEPVRTSSPGRSASKRARTPAPQSAARQNTNLEQPPLPIHRDPAGMTRTTRNTTGQLTAQLSNVVKIATIIFVIVLVLRVTPFGFSSLFGFAFVMFVLFSVLKISAGAGGRKTTRMNRVDSNDRWTG